MECKASASMLRPTATTGKIGAGAHWADASAYLDRCCDCSSISSAGQLLGEIELRPAVPPADLADPGDAGALRPRRACAAAVGIGARAGTWIHAHHLAHVDFGAGGDGLPAKRTRLKAARPDAAPASTSCRLTARSEAAHRQRPVADLAPLADWLRSRFSPETSFCGRCRPVPRSRGTCGRRRRRRCWCKQDP
jgi:hypothetical protein